MRSGGDSMPKVTIAHGGGGAAMHQLLEEVVLPKLCVAEMGEDAARVGGVVFTIDSFVVRPLRFPGGDIGKLAVYGTVNDLAMRGARPVAVEVAMVVEEGFDLDELGDIVQSVGEAARRCGVEVAGGDFKVVEAGRGDGLFITCAGIGHAVCDPLPSIARAQPGDAVLINGPIGQHGVAVLAAREGQGIIGAEVASDCAPLHEMCCALLGELGEAVHCLHDPTRGGLAAALNEIAAASGVQVVVREADIPRDGAVEAACEVLGLDSLEVANEGKVVAVVERDAAERAVQIMRQFAEGKEAAAIGEVVEGEAGLVVMQTEIGTRRVIDMPSGELLPRIC